MREWPDFKPATEANTWNLSVKMSRHAVQKCVCVCVCVCVKRDMKRVREREAGRKNELVIKKKKIRIQVMRNNKNGKSLGGKWRMACCISKGILLKYYKLKEGTHFPCDRN